MFNNIDEALNWLYSKRNNNKNKDRLNYLINKLDIYPKYKLILITGTNGKGSTALTIKHILKNINYHVGTFTSPFVIFFNDRIMINDRYISNSEIMHYLSILAKEFEEYYLLNNDIIPFFELTLLMALMYFKDRNIDLGVFECGIGGINDACNVLNPDISIITSIGYDHMNVLGNTLPEILSNKLGIARKAKPLLINNYNNLAINNEIGFDLFDVSNCVTNIKSSIYGTEFMFENKLYKTNLITKYQAYNCALAIKACKMIEASLPDDIINYSLSNILSPGRMERVSDKPLIYLDGAHNKEAIENSIEFISSIRENKRIICIFYSLKDKDYPNMLKILNNYVDEYYFTDLSDSRSISYELYLPYITKNYTYFDNYNELLSKLKDDNCLYLFTGSLHFVSMIRNLFK